MKISLDQIDFNPHRDLTAYPLSDKQIDSLVDSINQTGFWDNILVRKHPSNKNRFQLAYGHHRLEAAKQCGIIKGDIPCRVLSEDEMLRIMVKENSTQAGGQSVAATLDSVKAIIRRVAYLMLTNDYDHLGRIIPRCFESKKAFNTARGMLLSGGGLGHKSISLYDSSLTEAAIRPALGVLKADGSFKDILSETHQRIKEERTIAEELERELERKEAEEAEKERVAILEREAERLASLKRMAEFKAKREEVAAQAEKDRVERLERTIAEEAKRSSKAKEVAQKNKSIREERDALRLKAENDAKQAEGNVQDATIGKGIAKYFSSPHQLSAFRKGLLSDGAMEYIPIEQHEPIAKAIMASAEKAGVQATGAYISSYIESILAKALGTQRSINNKEDDDKKRDAREDNVILSSFRQSLESTKKNLSNLVLNFNTLSHIVQTNPALLSEDHRLSVRLRAEAVKEKIDILIAALEEPTTVG